MKFCRLVDLGSLYIPTCWGGDPGDVWGTVVRHIVSIVSWRRSALSERSCLRIWYSREKRVGLFLKGGELKIEKIRNMFCHVLHLVDLYCMWKYGVFFVSGFFCVWLFMSMCLMAGGYSIYCLLTLFFSHNFSGCFGYIIQYKYVVNKLTFQHVQNELKSGNKVDDLNKRKKIRHFVHLSKRILYIFN